ncbi:hypothetical protein HMPREF0322_00671 [Desulfitobacterium hafniense DP7]|uniref:Uncharacterized protein n=1 Tax=Desulfitobacterium hafniense DP7 TaxID=537010 RepID=G9XI95_DESHA|nr:hypothetical protein [Desulfitobacterium hafniense]EHL08578.1 hypothetical protein HMPREF0322_00671 [Desulfitobacterium hafniense DP7]
METGFESWTGDPVSDANSIGGETGGNPRDTAADTTKGRGLYIPHPGRRQAYRAGTGG